MPFPSRFYPNYMLECNARLCASLTSTGCLVVYGAADSPHGGRVSYYSCCLVTRNTVAPLCGRADNVWFVCERHLWPTNRTTCACTCRKPFHVAVYETEKALVGVVVLQSARARHSLCAASTGESRRRGRW